MISTKHTHVSLLWIVDNWKSVNTQLYITTGRGRLPTLNLTLNCISHVEVESVWGLLKRKINKIDCSLLLMIHDIAMHRHHWMIVCVIHHHSTHITSSLFASFRCNLHQPLPLVKQFSLRSLSNSHFPTLIRSSLHPFLSIYLSSSLPPSLS